MTSPPTNCPEQACETTAGVLPFLVPTKTVHRPGGPRRHGDLRRPGQEPRHRATGSPVLVTDILPGGLTYDNSYTPGVTVNGAAVTPTVNVTNPNQPIFTLPRPSTAAGGDDQLPANVPPNAVRAATATGTR